MSNLISAVDLSALPPERVRILDVRWRLGRADGHDEYLAGHIPGAVFVDLETELSSPGDPQQGRHPLPSTGQVQEAARRWGVNDGDTVVVYDDATKTTSYANFRAYKMHRDYRIHGFNDISWTRQDQPQRRINIQLRNPIAIRHTPPCSESPNLMISWPSYASFLLQYWKSIYVPAELGGSVTLQHGRGQTTFPCKGVLRRQKNTG